MHIWVSPSERPGDQKSIFLPWDIRNDPFDEIVLEVGPGNDTFEYLFCQISTFENRHFDPILC